MWTGQVGGGSPELAEGDISVVKLVGHANTKESLSAFVEEQRLPILDHTLFRHDLLPLFIACEVIEEGGSQLTEITPPHLHTADVLQVVELLVLLSGGKAEGLDSLIGIVLSQRVHSRVIIISH